MVVNQTKIYQKMENKRLLSIEKKYYRARKNAFQFRKFCFFIRKE